ILFADEAFWPGDRSAEGTLKRIITELTLIIEKKRFDAFEVANLLHILMATNADWVVPAGMDERRFAVFDCAKEKPSRDYFNKLYAEVANGGLAAMMHELMNMDLGNWHPRDDVPQTAALLEQKEYSFNSEQAWWYDVLQRGELPWGTTNNNSCPTKRLFRSYMRHAGRQYTRSTETMLGAFLNKYVPALDKKRVLYKIIGNKQGNIRGVGGRLSLSPDREVCREAFAKRRRHPITWQPPTAVPPPSPDTPPTWVKEPQPGWDPDDDTM